MKKPSIPIPQKGEKGGFRNMPASAAGFRPEGNRPVGAPKQIRRTGTRHK